MDLNHRAEVLATPLLRDRRWRSRHLVVGRLSPPTPSRKLIPRQRLSRLIARSLDLHGIVAITATAGAGKTTAATSAAEQLDRPVAWLTADCTDITAGRFLTYLEAAVAAQLPHVQATASDAIASGVPPAEAAAILAEATHGNRIVVVLDELERLSEAPEPWTVIESFLRYAPPSLKVILISRRVLPLRQPSGGRMLPAVGARELAFTAEEARDALAGLGLPVVDPAGIVAATGGWVTGVLFEAWQRDIVDVDARGEDNPLQSYMSAHILSHLGSEDREFLVMTSLLDVVTADRAYRLGLPNPGARLASLRRAYFPAEQRAGDMRCYPCFRELLLELLMQRDAAEVSRLRVRYGRILLAEHRQEDAVAEFLTAGALNEARTPAIDSITGIILRGEFDTADRWLKVLDADGELHIPRLMLAMAREDFRGGEQVVDKLADRGQLLEFTSSNEQAAILVSWLFLHHGRAADTQTMVNAIPHGNAADAIHYALQLYEDLPPRQEVTVPQFEFDNGPIDGLLQVLSYLHGQHAELLEFPESPWLGRSTEALRIAALRAMGRIETALELYAAASAKEPTSLSLSAFVGPELMIDAGRRQDAENASALGRKLVIANGGITLRAMNSLVEAKRLIVLEHDFAQGRSILSRLADEHGRSLAWIRELADMWDGVISLFEEDSLRAVRVLRAATTSMLRGNRLLELQSAAIYLAEAEWRVGEEEASDSAANLALRIAAHQGSNHGVLRALADFPSVASRRLDAEPRADSPWHALGRSLAVNQRFDGVHVSSLVLVREFGTSQICVDGQEVPTRLTKSVELLAFLSTRVHCAATREELIEALFHGRATDSVYSYLRQAVHQLRLAVGNVVAVTVERGTVRVGDADSVSSESVSFENKIAEAGRLLGKQRLQMLTEALTLFDRGVYHQKACTEWADARRSHLLQLAVDARLDSAEFTFAAGDFLAARRHVDAVLEVDPLREIAWRTKMRVAGALGDGDGVLRAFRACKSALETIHAAPSGTTQRLLDDLRV